MSKDATASAPPAISHSDGGGNTKPEDDDAVVSVYVPQGNGEWADYRLEPGKKLTVRGPNDNVTAIIQTDE